MSNYYVEFDEDGGTIEISFSGKKTGSPFSPDFESNLLEAYYRLKPALENAVEKDPSLAFVFKEFESMMDDIERSEDGGCC